METATKTGMHAAKTGSKRVVQNTAEATGDSIGNKIAEKITSLGKPNEKEKNKRSRRNLYSTKKRQQIIDELRLFGMKNVTPVYNNAISKNCKLS